MAQDLPLHNPVPLAERMRPSTPEHFFGQEQLISEGKILSELLKSGSVPSFILWGPPGTGKTSLARIISQATGATFVFFSAVLSGVQDVRKIVSEAQKRKEDDPRQKTIFFVDEIHRFNKSQQDAFLPYVESGLFTLIGATTENPSFQVIAPLLSRCRVLLLEPLSEAHLSAILSRALNDDITGLGSYNLSLAEKVLAHLINLADGDARRALNTLEIAATLSLQKTRRGEPAEISLDDIEEAAQQRSLRYDKSGEEHYNLISALHKSLRDSDPDGALYWFYRMIESGEDPLYISRRLIRFASEDIGVADPHALMQATTSRTAYQTLGSPEGELSLAQCVVYLATAPKSNRIYAASKNVIKRIQETGSLPVPLHIRNAPTPLMKKLGYGKDYAYAPNSKDGLVEQDHLPPELAGTYFYEPTNNGYESVIKDRLTKWKTILKNKRNRQ